MSTAVRNLVVSVTTLAVVGFAASPAQAATTFQDVLVQAPTIGQPQRGSLAGTLSRTAFGPGDLDRGVFKLPLPIDVPTERGPLLASVVPSYTPESGIGEWGGGWQADLAIRRFRATGEIDYATDDFTSPWGRLAVGADGYYPAGLGTVVRVVANGAGWVAQTTDGTRYTFDPADAVTTSRGTFEWMLSRVDNILGDSTTLQWRRNATGRPFLAAVHWGGRNDGTQYAMTFDYEAVATPFVSYISGDKQLLDQRITHVAVGVKQSGSYVTRWSYALDYQASPTGPAFYLHSITKTYVSGQSEPPVVYDYDLGAELRAAAQFADIAGLDSFISSHGGLVLQPDHASMTDLEQDGLPDVEIAFDQTTLRQTATGFITEALPPADSANSVCRPPALVGNKPRTLARMHGNAVEPQAVWIKNNPDGVSTHLLVCDRLGVPIYDQSVTGSWGLNENTRLADLDMDQRPDLVRVSLGKVQVLHNTSTSPQAIAFEVGPVTALTPQFTPVATWVLDFNGDGRADLMVRSTSGVVVWLGKGGGQFEPVGTNYGFVTPDGPLANFASYQFSHGDFNGDGLSDVILTHGQTALLFTNQGGSFVETPVSALSNIPWTFSYPLVEDLSGSGNEEVVFVTDTQAMALQLTSPATGLLRSADDGKGTVIRFGYGRIRPAPGIRRRYATLSSLTVESSGYDPVTYGYDYGAPVLQTVGKYLVGFASVDKQSPLFHEHIEFLNDDDITAVHRLSEDTDDRSPGIIRFTRSSYDDVQFHGVRWLRPSVSETGHHAADGTVTLSTTKQYVTYERGFCPTVTTTTMPGSQLVHIDSLATVAALPDDLHCLAASERLLGSHTDPLLDFNYLASLTRNDLGQVTNVTQFDWLIEPLVLQDITYTADHRVKTVGAPGRGMTTASYDALGILASVTDPLGVVTQIDSLDPVSDAPLQIQTARPGAPSTAFLRYDGRERLQKTWDDVSGGGEAQPLVSYAYHDVTNTSPGRIDSLALADAITGISRRGVALLSADGETLVQGTWLGDHFSLGTSSISFRNTLAKRGAFFGTITDAALSALPSADLRARGTPLTETLEAGFGHPVQMTTTYQAGVVGVVTHELLLGPTELVTRSHEPGGFTAESAVDAAGNLIRKTDESGVAYRYTFDALGRLIHLDTPDGAHSVEFDDFGRPERVTRDGIGSVTYAYDPTSGLVVQKQHLDSAGNVVDTSTTSYDGTGRPTESARTADSDTSNLHYDYDGQLDSSTVPGQLGRLSRVRGDGWERSELFDPLGRSYYQHIALTGWRDLTSDKDYRADGTVASDTLTIRDPGGTTRFTTTQETVLDGLGRVGALKIDGNVLYTLSYDDESRLQRADFASGEKIVFDYDATTHARRGYTVTAPGSSGGVHWDRDPRGLVAGETYDHGTATSRRDYTYDGRSELITATTGGDVASYTYTASGLPDQITDAAGTRSVHRTAGALTVGDVAYTWDASGRVAAKDAWTFGYGPHGQLSHAHRPGRDIDYVYDDGNQRILKRVDGVPVRADVAGGVLTEDHFVELISVGGVAAGVLDNGRFSALLSDPRGTPFIGPDGASNLASPYGVRTSHLAFAEAIDYARLGWDPDLDVVRMGVRDYDAKLSQFLTPDPLYFEDLERCQGSPLQCSLYGYAGGNPVSFVDPSGTDFLEWVAGGVGVLVGGFDAVTFGLYSKAYNPSGDWNSVPHYHTAHLVGEIAAGTALTAVGVSEVGAALKAGQMGMRMLVAAKGVNAASAGARAVAAVADAGLTAYAGTSLATSLSNEKAGSPASSGERKLPRYDGPKPKYHVNEAHVKSSGNLRPGKEPLPSDAAKVYETAVPDSAQGAENWFGKNPDGTIYRFSGANDGTAHFSGSSASKDGIRNITDYAIDRLEGK